MVRTVEVPVAGPVFDRRMMNALWLGALPAAVSCGRLHLKHLLLEWGFTDLIDDAQVVASELLTNAVTATTTETGPIKAVCLLVCTDGKALLIEVRDWSPETPKMGQTDYEAIGARGLVLVDALSTEWGWYFTGPNRKVVWAIL